MKKIFIFSVLFCLVSDIPRSEYLLYVLGSIFLSASIFYFLLANSKKSATTLLVILFSSRDIWFGDGGVSVVSIWQQQFSIINPSMIVMVLAIITLIKNRIKEIPKEVLFISLIFLLMPMIAGLLSGSLLDIRQMVEVITDIKFFVMFALGIILAYTLIINKTYTLEEFLKIILIILFARHFVDFIYFLIGYGPYFSGIANRVSMDSLKGGVILLIFYSFLNFSPAKKNYYTLLIAFSCLLLLFVYSTRMLWVTFVLGFSFIFFRSNFGFKFKATIFLILLMILISFAMQISIFELQYNRFKTLTDGREESLISNLDENFLSRIDPVRYAQYFNVWSKLLSDNSILWGQGIGGYYNNYPYVIPNTLEAAFPDYSFETNRYYKTHEMLSHILLKFGLIGVFAYFYFHLKSIIGWISILNQNRDPLIRSYICLFPTVFLQFYWSGKNILFMGMFLAIGLIGLRLRKDVR